MTVTFAPKDILQPQVKPPSAPPASAQNVQVEVSTTFTAAPASEAPALKEGDQVQLQTHVVKKGDNLWAIAGEKLGDPRKWPSIFAQNQDRVNNPNLIYPGQELKIPQQNTPETQPPPAAEPSSPETSAPVCEEASQPEPVCKAPAPASPPAEIVLPAVVTPAASTAVMVAKPPSVVVAPQPVTKSHKTLKIALMGGAIGSVGTAGTLIAMTSHLSGPAANLGGYATAQTIARSLSHLGLSVPQGPALTKIVSSVGGPKVAAAAAAVGIGLAVASVAAGGYYLYNKVADKK